jgi:hypothetical protein
MISGRDALPFGLRVLKTLCLLYVLLSLLHFVLGPHSGQWSKFGVVVVWGDEPLSPLAVVSTLFYAAGFYGIHRRLAFTWIWGWLLIGTVFVGTLAACLASTLKASEPACWILSAAVVVGCTAVAVYWGLWWNRQKGYFLLRKQ